ncbi:unnamed protein product, partial [Ixodes hexagonus]
ALQPGLGSQLEAELGGRRAGARVEDSRCRAAACPTAGDPGQQGRSQQRTLPPLHQQSQRCYTNAFWCHRRFHCAVVSTMALFLRQRWFRTDLMPVEDSAGLHQNGGGGGDHESKLVGGMKARGRYRSRSLSASSTDSYSSGESL